MAQPVEQIARGDEPRPSIPPRAKSPPVMTVIDEHGRRHQVIGWAAYLVGLATACADQLNAAGCGQLVADFGPTSGMSLTLRSELGRVKQRP